jgi:glycosyltransferase involved in cell wall biosynthesis
MSGNNEKISVLIPTYNRSNLLKDCINSVLNQTYQNLEIYIIDDCSSDNTEEIVKSFDSNKIIYLKNQKNLGSIMGDREHFRRFFYELMSGDYFIYITDDDYWPDNNFLRRCVDIFKKYPTVSSVIGSQLSEFYEEESSLKYRNILDIQKIIDNNQLNKFNMYFHKDLFETGFLAGKQYLKKFSENSTSINISVTGTVRRKNSCTGIDYLSSKNPSKWQGGYEFNIPPAILHDVYFINEPCVVARVGKENASFRFTQFDHYMDSILSINNAFFQVTGCYVNLKKEFIKSLSRAYISNSIHIMSGKKLSMTSIENNQRYVTVKDVLKVYLNNKIILDCKDINYFIKYFKIKLISNFLK